MTTVNLNAFVKGRDHDGYNAIETKDLMWGLSAYQHELVECMTPEGPSDDFSWKIILVNWFSGWEYELKTEIVGKIEDYEFEDEEDGFYECGRTYVNGRTIAERLIEKMKAKGTLNLAHWNKIK